MKVHDKVLVGGLRTVGHRGRIFIDHAHDCVCIEDDVFELRCTVCKGDFREGSMTTLCPGTELTAQQRKAVIEGRKDFVEWGWDAKT